MALFKWRDDFSVNVGAFDAHHKKLVDLLNNLHDYMLEGKHQDVTGKILKELHDYTKYHFESEEQLMLKHGFPEYSQHKLQHDNFIAKIDECMSKSESGALGMTIDLMDFLSDWLRNHIMGTDKKYVQFFKSKGVA